MCTFQSYNKGSHQAPIGPRNEEHSASIPKSSEKYLDSQTSKVVKLVSPIIYCYNSVKNIFLNFSKSKV